MGKLRWLGWALWLAGAALLWLFENNAATLTLLAVSILLPPASILAAKGCSRRVRLTLAAREREFSLRLEGLGLLSCAAGKVLCENRLTEERAEIALAFSPRLRGESLRSWRLDAAHCGTLRLRTELRIRDLFGLWQSAPLACGEEFITLPPRLFSPAVYLTDSAAAFGDSEQYSQLRPGSDPSETFAIREYVPGDPIRQIHWKLSQKTDTLMLRELGLPVISQTLLIFRNLRLPGETVSPDTANAMAEIFLSVSQALMSQGIAHTAAFVEHGHFSQFSVQNELDCHAMQAGFLTIGWEAEGGLLLRLLTETPSTHVVIVSASVPPEAERLCMNNRVTLITSSVNETVPGVYTLPFRAESVQQDISILEI